MIDGSAFGFGALGASSVFPTPGVERACSLCDFQVSPSQRLVVCEVLIFDVGTIVESIAPCFLC